MYKNIFLHNFTKNKFLINCYKIRNISKDFSDKIINDNKNSKKLNDFRNKFRQNLNYPYLNNSSFTELNDNNNLTIKQETIEQSKIFNSTNSKVVQKTTNFYVRQNEDSDGDLIPQRDLVPDIRAKGIFERDPNDKETP